MTLDKVVDGIQAISDAVNNIADEQHQQIVDREQAFLNADSASLGKIEGGMAVEQVAGLPIAGGVKLTEKLIPDRPFKTDSGGSSKGEDSGGTEAKEMQSSVDSDTMLDGSVVPNKAWKDKSIFNAYPERTELSMSGIDEQAAFLSRHVPGLGNEQATLILNHGFKRDSSVVIGGSRVRGDFVDGSDIDIGFGGFTEKQHQNVVKSIDKATSLNSEFLNLEKLQIVPEKSTATIDPIVSPEEFFQRSGIRSANDGKKAGQPYVPSGSITLTSDGKIVVIPPGAGL